MSSLFQQYTPITLNKWISFSKHCGVLSLHADFLTAIFENESVSELESAAFCRCVTRLAHELYKKNRKPCQVFYDMHLIPLYVKTKCPPLFVSLCNSGFSSYLMRNRSGMKKYFDDYGQGRVLITLDGFKKMLRQTGIFPYFISAIHIDEAWKGAFRDSYWDSDPFQKETKTFSLRFRFFIEAVCRVLVKTYCLTKESRWKDLECLFERFFFPRRIGRYLRANPQVEEKKEENSMTEIYLELNHSM